MTRPRAAAAVLAAAAVVAIAAIVAVRPAGPGVERPILLVSGRDDHGLLATPTVALLDEPEGAEAAEVADGTLVAVTGTRSEWLRVEALEGPPASGWIHDFYLRGTVHVVGKPPGCPTPLVGKPGGPAFTELRASEQVELVDVHETDGATWVGVRTLGDGAQVGVVPRAWLRELALPPVPPGVACADVRVDPAAPPHRH
ncbi:MAG: hypothetical protein ACRDUY_06870 [Nitriliruptorales bacterium]